MGMALVNYDTIDEYWNRRDRMIADGLCAHGWVVYPKNGQPGVVVACVKPKNHHSDHRAWGGHTLRKTPVPRPNKS